MEYYDNKPNLIQKKMHKTVNKIMQSKNTNATISDKISNAVSNFYKTYIEKNKLLSALIVLIILFLLYRYFNKNKKSINIPTNDYDDIIKEILNEDKFIDNNEIIKNSQNYFPNYNKQDQKKNNVDFSNIYIDPILLNENKSEFSMDPPYATNI
ncbi:Hypothetical protein KVN_LOCUS334 [uncultured virus]|nr:Hypothetical protein KVN_LOCUS334 [uncultured virus]